MAAAKSRLPRFSSRQPTSDKCGNRNSQSLCPLHIDAGISNSEMCSEKPLPSAFIRASFIVHRRKKSCRFRFASAPASRDCSSEVSASPISTSRLRRASRGSTSTPTLPRRASAISPWRPLWLTLKLTGARCPRTWADGLPYFPSVNVNSSLEQSNLRQRITRSAARHRANSRRGGSRRNFLHRSCSSRFSQLNAVRSASGCGERSTSKTLASPGMQKGRHQRCGAGLALAAAVNTAGSIGAGRRHPRPRAPWRVRRGLRPR